MPAITHQHQEAITPAGKKRRRDDGLDEQQPHPPPYEGLFCLKRTTPPDFHATNAYLHSPTEQQHHNHSAYPHAARKHFPLPTPKRLRKTTDRRSHSRSVSPEHNVQTPPRERHEPLPDTVRPTPVRHDSALLTRCHICHRKPARKSDLDSFGDCEGCGQRTCFVCLRECLDWRTEEQKRWGGYRSASFTMRDLDDPVGSRDGGEGDVKALKGVRERSDGEQMERGDGEKGWKSGGHRKKICSRCCVERGPDGDVVCLGCLPFVEG